MKQLICKLIGHKYYSPSKKEAINLIRILNPARKYIIQFCSRCNDLRIQDITDACICDKRNNGNA